MVSLLTEEDHDLVEFPQDRTSAYYNGLLHFVGIPVLASDFIRPAGLGFESKSLPRIFLDLNIIRVHRRVSAVNLSPRLILGGNDNVPKLVEVGIKNAGFW